MNCSNCMSEVAEGFRFCPNCGAPLMYSTAGGEETHGEKAAYPKMIDVAGGFFFMGNDVPDRKVSVVSFSISETPVTQYQYETVMGNNPSKLIGAERPVESVNWCEAIIFCNTLSLRQGYVPCYNIGNNVMLSSFDASSPIWKRLACNFNANGYRLPSEAEWEYAARGGAAHFPSQFAGSDNINKVAWYGENSDVSTHDVGKRVPNGLGLYDMCGNVSEWCWDYMAELPLVSQQYDPHGPISGSMHVKRGGSWLDDAQQCTVYYRSGSAPTGKSSCLGFRVCRTLPHTVL